MRWPVLLLAIALVAVALISAVGWLKYTQLFPRPSREIAWLDPANRVRLIQLRNELKFEPHEFPPLGYTGIATPEEGATARAAVNDTLDAILSRPDGPISAATVSDFIGRGLKRVKWLETEDRDRTGDYMIEIWYILGFKGATGRFAYGSAFPRPDGYGEPLPPGWKSPTQPRPIERK